MDFPSEFWAAVIGAIAAGGTGYLIQRLEPSGRVAQGFFAQSSENSSIGWKGTTTSSQSDRAPGN